MLKNNPRNSVPKKNYIDRHNSKKKGSNKIEGEMLKKEILSIHKTWIKSRRIVELIQS